jgi:hypothetical protein
VSAYNYQHSGFYSFAGIMFHGRYTHANLIEGNDWTDNVIRIGDVKWGKNGPNIFFRNRVSSTDNWGLFETKRIAGSAPTPIPYDGVVVIGNMGYGYASNYGCDYNGNGRCDDIDRGAGTPGGDDGYFERNIAFDTKSSAGCTADKEYNSVAQIGAGCCTGAGTGNCWWGFNLATPQASTQCGTGSASDCPGGIAGDGASEAAAVHGTNIEALVAPSGWNSETIPFSLYFTSVEDWEAQTGATWCQEACDFEDVHNGIGAWGDDMGGTTCKLPAQIRDEAGTCTPLDTGGTPAGAALPSPRLRAWR